MTTYACPEAYIYQARMELLSGWIYACNIFTDNDKMNPRGGVIEKPLHVQNI